MMRSVRAEDAYFTFGLASQCLEPQPYVEFHRHNEVELQYIARGALTQLLSSGSYTVAAGQFSLLWGAMPHRVTHIEPRTEMHWLTVPLAWFLEWQLPDAIQRPLFDGEVLFDANERSAADLELFSRWHVDLKKNSDNARKLVLLEAEARIRRMRPLRGTRKGAPTLKRPSAKRSGTAGNLTGLGKVEVMAAYVARHYREDLSVPQIARAAGLHPDYAVTLFRKTCGIGLVEYYTQHRISHAQRLLATTNQKILDVALDSGFGSASRFYAAFMQICKRSPKEYRREFSVTTA